MAAASLLALAVLPGLPTAPGVPARGGLWAQERGPAGSEAADEVRLLREAAAREEAGDLEAAETLLLRILDQRPGSVPALLALERVLRVQGRVEALPDPVRRALADDPGSSLLNQLLLRTLASLDRTDALEMAARDWIRIAPELEIPYRETARIWAERGRLDRARRVLEEGRERAGRPDALALELGDLYAAVGELERAVAEWDRAIGAEGRGLIQVRRRIRALPDGGAAVLARLARRLAAAPTTPARREAAVEVAVDARLEALAREVAAGLLSSMPLEERSRFLSGVARRADRGELHRLAHWAYGTLLELEEDRSSGTGRASAGASAGALPRGPGDVQEARVLALRGRVAELALLVGDTAGAAREFRSIEEAYGPGSPERRKAAAHRLDLMADTDPDEAVASLRAFQADFPNAPERDRLAAAVAAALVDRGRREEAEALLAGVRGPRSARLRARLALERGDVGAARIGYVAAAGGLTGAEATEVLTLATTVGRLSEPAGAALGTVLALRDGGRPGEAVDGLVAALPGLRSEDHAPLLQLVAELAEGAGLEADARRLRQRIVAEHPRTTEAPAALLALARSLRSEPGGDGEARDLLERLILEYPRSALVPQARRELEGLRGSGVAGPQSSG